MPGVLTVGDVMDRVKRTFGDESSAQVTEQDILRWINDAQREAVMQNEGLIEKIDYLDTVSGTSTYTLPQELFVLKHAWIRDSNVGAYYALRGMSTLELNENVDGWDGSDLRSMPLIFTQRQSDTITVIPTPEVSVAQGIKFQYSSYASDVSDSADPLALPPYLHTYVVNFCLMQAYEMDEDWESASQKAQQIQGDLDFNNNRRFWFNRESYPTITVRQDDLGD